MPAPKTFKWDETKSAVLQAIFAGQETHDAISANFHITSRTLRNWMAHPEFQAALKTLRDQLEQSLLDRGELFTRKEQRIIALSRKAASASKEYDEHPWRKEKRADPSGPPITNLVYNREAFDAFRGALDDIAKEQGHRKAVTEVTGKDGGPIEVEEKRARLIEKLGTIAGPNAADCLVGDAG